MFQFVSASERLHQHAVTTQVVVALETRSSCRRALFVKQSLQDMDKYDLHVKMGSIEDMGK